MRVFDRAELVLIAAEATGVDPERVLDGANVAVLVSISARLRGTTGVADAAAEVLVGIAASRPFVGDNRSVAWLAAAHLAEVNGRTITLDDDQVCALVADAERGAVDERAAATLLAAHVRRRPGLARRRARQAVGSLWKRRDLIAIRPCPACGLPVALRPVQALTARSNPFPRDLVAGCWREHGSHRRDGSEFPPPRASETATRRPVGAMAGT